MFPTPIVGPRLDQHTEREGFHDVFPAPSRNGNGLQITRPKTRPVPGEGGKLPEGPRRKFCQVASSRPSQREGRGHSTLRADQDSTKPLSLTTPRPQYVRDNTRECARQKERDRERQRERERHRERERDTGRGRERERERDVLTAAIKRLARNQGVMSTFTMGSSWMAC